MRNLILLSASLLLAGCNFFRQSAQVGTSSSSSVQSSSMSSSAVSSAMAGSSVGIASSAPMTTEPRVIMMSAENWQFTPNVIHAKQGEKVTIHLSGLSGTHGFTAPGLNINTSVVAGNSVEVTLPTEKTGTFQFFCSIPCGSGHKDMKGQIVIEE